MVGGWIKLHRQIAESRVFGNADLLQVWLYCLIRASHSGQWVTITTGRGKTDIQVLPGQFIYGRNIVARAIGISPSTLRNRIAKLARLGNITVKADTHCSIITICNWDKYQGGESDTGQATGQPKDNQRTTKGHIQEGKESKNEKNSSLALTIGQDWNTMTRPEGLKEVTLPLSKGRLKHLSARLKESAWQDGKHREIFRRVVLSKFLTGDNDSGWRASFDWLIKNDTNYAKVLEKAYERADKTRKPPTGLFDSPEQYDL